MDTRRYGTGDQEAVLAMAPRLRIGVTEWRPEEPVVAATTRWLEHSIDDLDTDVFVACDQGEVVGVATLSTRTHFTGEVDAYVGELVVAGHMRGDMSAQCSWGPSRP